VVDSQDRKKESVFFDGEIVAYDNERKLVVKKKGEVIAVFINWDWYRIVEDDKSKKPRDEPLSVVWKAIRKARDEYLNKILMESIVGSKIIDIDIQGTRIILRTDAKPVVYADVIYDTSRILVKS